MFSGAFRAKEKREAKKKEGRALSVARTLDTSPVARPCLFFLLLLLLLLYLEETFFLFCVYHVLFLWGRLRAEQEDVYACIRFSTVDMTDDDDPIQVE